MNPRAIVVALTLALMAGPTAAAETDPASTIAAINTAQFIPETPAGTSSATDEPDPLTIKLQVLLDRVHISPGVIDGYQGDNVAKALEVFEWTMGLPVDGRLDSEVWLALQAAAGASDPLEFYVIRAEDIAGPFVAEIPQDYGEMAKLDRLAYESPAEMLAERFHMDEDLLEDLNPDADFGIPGAMIVVANPGTSATTPVARLEIDGPRGLVRGLDADGNLVVAYPATVGSDVLPSPMGSHLVEAVVPNAAYWYRPDVNFRQGDNDKALEIASGPNNPIGSVWIDLSEPTYGIHGTPDPSHIAKLPSHGCVRLTNWDVEELAGLVAPGAEVVFLEPSQAASQPRRGQDLRARNEPVRPLDAEQPGRALE